MAGLDWVRTAAARGLRSAIPAVAVATLGLASHGVAFADPDPSSAYLHGDASGTDVSGLFGVVGADVQLTFEASGYYLDHFGSCCILIGGITFTDVSNGAKYQAGYIDANGIIARDPDGGVDLAIYPPFNAPGFYIHGNDAGSGSGIFAEYFPDFTVGDVFSLSHVSDAPEPSTWALTFAGVGLAGFALRSRKRVSPLAA